jgi:hypothetical protein
MPGVSFSHPNPSIGSLFLRLAPTMVDWSFNLNTKVQDTYGGQVVQLLSINFDKFVISGQFGKEGPRGATRGSDKEIFRRSQMNNNLDGGVRDYSGSAGLYSNGLTQMTEYFSRYFSLATQGVDTKNNYDERPMTISYEGALDVPTGVAGQSVEQWKGYPISFPSYKRSNQNFAPQWMVEFKVYEAPARVNALQRMKELDRLKNDTGYRPNNEFSDPYGRTFLEAKAKGKDGNLKELLKIAQAAVDEDLDNIARTFGELMPAFTDAALEELILQSASIPTTPTPNK